MTLINPPQSTTGTILKTDTNGRVRTPPELRERLLDAFEHSSMTAKAFADHHGIKYPTFAYWRKMRKQAVEISPPDEDCAVFAEINLQNKAIDPIYLMKILKGESLWPHS